MRKLIPCGYCFQEWATGYDHIIPRSMGGSNRMSNKYPCCTRCNSILGAKTFASLEEKRAYIQEELKRRGEWQTADGMQTVREADNR